MDGHVSQQDPTEEPFHFKNSPVPSRAESGVSEESSGPKRGHGLTLEGADVLHFFNLIIGVSCE